MTDTFEVFRECGQSVNNEDILSLTREIMSTAGYKRVDGKNIYEKPLDSCLVAKWVWLCRKIFSSIVSNSSYVKPFISDIISTTVTDFFNNVNLDIIGDNPKILYTYLQTIIVWRKRRYVKYAKRREGIVVVKERKSSKRRTKPTAKDTAGYSYDKMTEGIDSVDPYADGMYDSIDSQISNVNFVRDMLKGDDFALTFLDGIMSKYGKIDLRRANNYIYIPKEQQTEEMKKRIADAYNKIANATAYVFGINKLSRKTSKSVAFNGEGIRP